LETILARRESNAGSEYSAYLKGIKALAGIASLLRTVTSDPGTSFAALTWWLPRRKGEAMQFRWVASITLWTFLVGPILSPAPPAVRTPQMKAAVRPGHEHTK
jgi:hypothetical protein